MSDDAARDEENAPAWQLLPDDPVGFFGLQDGYDRKDLKRAYNALLRRYKPDKSPQEFQKLRAAFEQLDGELRYGQSLQQPQSRIDDYQWKPSARADEPKDRSGNVAPTGAQDTPADKETTKQPPRESSTDKPLEPREVPKRAPVPKTLQERIETESLASLYEELKLNPREPYDYYVLALLSDAVADPEHLVFLRWLLSGIKTFPNHPALMQLLTVYFRDGDLPKEHLAPILVRVSQVVNNDRFYFLTEKLFDRLTLTAPWPQVEETLKRCAANINDHNIRSRVVFTCHLVRRALWLAPIEKCQEMLSYVNDNYEYLEGSLEYEQELNSMLLSFVQDRQRFVQKGPISQMIDQALQKYCLDTDGRGDYEVVKVHAYIAHHPEQLFREFGLRPEEDMQLLMPWIWISDEVEDRLETQVNSPKPEQLMSATFQMLQQIDNNFPLTPIQFYNMLDRAVPLVITLFLLFALPIMVGLSLEAIFPSMEKLWGSFFLVVGIALAATYWFWVQRFTTAVWLIKYLKNMIQKHYLKWWRSLIGRFFAATHFSYREVDHAIDTLLAAHRADLNISNWLPHFYSRDPALYVYATAVRFLR